MSGAVRASIPTKPRLGIMKFASCDGCQLTLLDLEDHLLDLLERFDLVEFAEASVVPLVRPVRRRARRGLDQHAGAGRGDRPHPARDAAARDHRGVRDGRRHPGPAQLGATTTRIERPSTPHPEYVESLATSTPIADHVAVDAELRGCPIDPGQLLELLTALVVGRRPQLPDESVCLECKRRGTVCVLVTGQGPCLGPVTHTGCGAMCPAFARGCYGCFGPREAANADEPGQLVRARRPLRRRHRPTVLRLHRLRPALPGGHRPPGRTADRERTADRQRTTRRRALRGGPLMHDTHTTGEIRYEVAGLTRVEGEGSLRLVVRDGDVIESQLAIFEAPRYFEQLVVGRTPDEVLDIVARICGICPVAYQMSAVHAFEDLAGRHRRTRRPRPAPAAVLRRVDREPRASTSTCCTPRTSWASQNAVELAALDRAAVERGLALKKAGNRIVAVLGGRPIHPVSVRVGGFSKVPTRAELEVLRPDLEAALGHALATVDWVAGFTAPSFERDERFVVAAPPDRVPDERRADRLVRRPRPRPDRLGVRLRGGAGPVVARAPGHMPRIGSRTCSARPPGSRSPATSCIPSRARPWTGSASPTRSGATRTGASPPAPIELVHAVAEALDIIDAYRPPERAAQPWTPRPGTASWATEAPRGLLFHHYELDERGRIATAKIVPPTSQNQAAIEADMTSFAPAILAEPHDVATHRLEQLIRSYDPCISCATHFLDLRVEAAP